MTLDGSVVDQDGNLYALAASAETQIVKIDGDSLTVTTDASQGVQGFSLAITSIYDLAGRHDFVLWVGFLGTPTRLYRADDLSLVWIGSGVTTRPRGVTAGRRAFGRAEAFVAAAPSATLGAATSPVVLRHIVLEPPFFLDPLTGNVPGLSYP